MGGVYDFGVLKLGKNQKDQKDAKSCPNVPK
jgi:hypothetical protein